MKRRPRFLAVEVDRIETLSCNIHRDVTLREPGWRPRIIRDSMKLSEIIAAAMTRAGWGSPVSLS